MLSGNIWLVVTLALLHNSGPISGFSFYHERENPKQELAPNSRDRIPDNLENELWKRNKKETYTIQYLGPPHFGSLLRIETENGVRRFHLPPGVEEITPEVLAQIGYLNATQKHPAKLENYKLGTLPVFTIICLLIVIGLAFGFWALSTCRSRYFPNFCSEYINY